jgi:hypothetical protein
LGETGAVAAPIAANRANLDFVVAVAGWMPVGMGGAVFISLWVLARARPADRATAVAESRFDFNLGYAATVLLALVFLVMGTALLFGRDQTLASSSAGFAAELVALFANAVGGWIRPVIGIAALAVMFSTVLAVIDGFPRVYANVSSRLLAAGAGAAVEQRLYLGFLVLQALVALVLLTWLLASFGVFIDFATTAGFVTAPVIAYLNHRIIQSPQMPASLRAPRWLIRWSGLGVIVLTAASATYIYFRFG